MPKSNLTKSPKNNRRTSHSELQIFKVLQAISNTPLPSLALVHLSYLVSVQRELLLQVAQHLYSTSLVVQMRDSSLRLQKEQFCSIFLVLQTRVSPKTLLVLVLCVVSGNWLYTGFALVAGYGPAWVGHYVFENNRPATFRYPLWSFVGDWVMFADIVRGRVPLSGDLHPDLFRGVSEG